MSTDKKNSDKTRLVHSGRSATAFGGAVNPSVQRASTLLLADSGDLYGSKKTYGRMGMEAQDVLCQALCDLENAKHTQLTSNGLSACALAIASCVNSGDHLLVTDSAYGPTRRFCERYLKRMGVSVDFFTPRIRPEALEQLIKPKTKAIFLEMPGSLTFEMHDLPALLEVTSKYDVTSILDNTWGAGVFFKPLDHGVDISVQALTKYVVGHADAFGGAAMTNGKRHASNLENTANDWGISLSADEAYLAQRGIRTLHTRIKAQEKAGLEVADWLHRRDAVAEILHPAFENHPDHGIWKTLYSGSCGLFSFLLKPCSQKQQKAFFDALELFGFGFSWGGFESLIIPCDPQLKRSVSSKWDDDPQRGALIRVSVGLEDPKDLIADLQRGFQALST